MALALAERPGRMSPDEFLAFYEGRPEEERWELYDGVPVQMMTPPFLIHNQIGSNLERLLNDAMRGSGLPRLALQRPGLELPEADNYRPEPDLAVIDSEFPPDLRYVRRAYLLGEILSSSDRERVSRLRRSRIEAKREIYRRHLPCEAILFVEQGRMEVEVGERSAEGWTSRRLADPGEILHLPTFGLSCRLDDIYADTPIGPRRHGGNGR